MKRTAVVTAAALMFAGMTSFSFAGDKEHNSMQKESSAVSSEVTQSANHNEKEAKAVEAPSSQPAAKSSETKEVKPTSKNEKQSEPMAENKPAATLSDATKSTMNATSDHMKETVKESAKSAKSAVPTPSVPTTPAVEAAKTAVTPAAPTSTPTK